MNNCADRIIMVIDYQK